MIAARAALLAALLLANSAAPAQPSDASDVAPVLRDGVMACRAGDLATAELALRRLATGNPDAEAWLGVVLLDRGLNRDALQTLQHAADSGSAEGNHRLALVFAQGLAGTPRNDARALGLFEKAAALGNQRAQVNVGILYFRGQGTPRDLVQARAWLEKAAANNDPYGLYSLRPAMDETLGPAGAGPGRAPEPYRRAAGRGPPSGARPPGPPPAGTEPRQRAPTPPAPRPA